MSTPRESWRPRVPPFRSSAFTRLGRQSIGGPPKGGTANERRRVNRRLFDDLVHLTQDVAQDFDRRLGGVNAMNELLAVKTQQRLGLAVIHLEPVADDLEVGV